jgi:hypothetical protein
MCAANAAFRKEIEDDQPSPHGEERRRLVNHEAGLVPSCFETHCFEDGRRDRPQAATLPSRPAAGQQDANLLGLARSVWLLLRGDAGVCARAPN